MFRIVLAAFTILFLSSCTTKNEMSLIFSSENIPKATLKLNQGRPYTNELAIPLEITVSRDSVEMSISSGKTCSDIWEPFSSARTVVMPDVEGEHIISVKIRTEDGFESECTQAHVVLDKSGPTVSSSLSLENSRSLPTQSPRLLPPATTDIYSGVSHYEIKLVKTAGTTTVKDWTIKDKDALYFNDLNLPDVEADSYFYLIRAVDNTGNVSIERQSPDFVVGPVVTLSNDTQYHIHQTMGLVEVSLSRSSSLPVSVSLKGISGSAIAGLDFLFPDILPLEVVVPAGATTARAYYSIMNRLSLSAAKYFEIGVTGTTNSATSFPKHKVELLALSDVAAGQIASGYREIVGGQAHMCAVRTDNKMDCWGAQKYATGQTSDVLMATEVAGVSNIQSLGKGYSTHNCYVDTVGDLYCFGSNENKQLGNGTSISSSTPVKMVGYSNVKKVSVGMGFTCFIDSSDRVRCLGQNSEATVGQDATTPIYDSPVLFSPITKAIDITAGNRMACAIDEVTGVRTVKCWGKMDKGQAATPTPVSITGVPNDIVSISANGSILSDSRHGCGVTEEGEVYCWGSSYRSRRGTSSSSVAWASANKVSLPVKAVKVQAGPDSSCALGEDNLLYCWGAGVIPSGSAYEYTETSVPVVMNMTGDEVIDFQLTDLANCAITSNSRIKCWGVNRKGTLGNGRAGDALRAVAFSPGQSFDKYLQVAAGAYSTCAIRENKTVTCWGLNDEGQLGINSTNTVSRPIRTASGLVNVKKIAGRASHYCALTEGGSVYCWGYNLTGQVGNNTTDPEPSPVLAPYQIPTTFPNGTAGLPGGIKDISVGYNHSCAVTAAGGVMCWGHNTLSAVGQGVGLSYSYPVAVGGLASGVESISLGFNTSCAIRVSGGTKSIYCWGWNNMGILGNSIPLGFHTNGLVLIDTITTAKEVKLFVGYESACYIHDGQTKCWGYHTGNFALPLPGTIGTQTAVPTVVPELAGAAEMTLGAYAGCAAMTAGAVKCWGVDNSGFVSNLNQILQTPTQSYAFGFGKAVNLSMGLSDKVTDYIHICGISSLGDLKCWGASTFGEAHDLYFAEPSYVMKP